jgi:hypothetical protein
MASANFSWPILIVCSLLLFGMCAFWDTGQLNDSLGDTDDALRLVQVREFLASGNWFDLHMDRLAPPEGYSSHWSRIPDALMAPITFIAGRLVGADQAEFWMRAIYPGLWIVVAYLAAVAGVFQIVRHSIASTGTLLAVAGSTATFTQFLAGRIDHHGAQIALCVVAVVCVALSQERKAYAAIAGVVTALGLAIGLEGLILFLVPAAALVMWFIIMGQGRETLRAYAIALLIGSIVALLLHVPFSAITKTACDAYGFNWAVGIAGGSLILSIFLPPSSESRALSYRLVLAFGAALVAGVLFVLLYPSCLSGPFADVDPLLKTKWLNNVFEMQPTLQFADGQLLRATLPLIAYVLPTACLMIWLLTMEKYRRNFAFLTLSGGFVVSAVLGLLSVRSAFYCIWFVPFILVPAAFELFARLTGTSRAIAALLTLALSPVTFSAGLAYALPYLASQPKQSAIAGPISDSDCLDSAHFAELANLPRGIVIGDVDLGPYVLALTPHSVMSAPYHRIDQRILETFAFLGDLNFDQAKAYALANKIDYVVTCKATTMRSAVGENAILLNALLAHNQPDWLRPVAVSDDNPVEVYAVVK